MADRLTADVIGTQTAYPTALQAIHFGATGDVVRITLRDGSSLPVADHGLAARPVNNIDLVRIYTLPVHYVLLLRKDTGRYKYAWHMPSCKGVGTDVDVDVSGESIVHFATDGTISKVEYPDGQVREAATDDLMQQEIANVDVVAFRTYTLLEFRDGASKEVSYRVL